VTDIGFGLINRRTVIVVLFTMVISVVLLNNQLPISTKNAGELFIDTVVFTGYFIILRSAFRLPFAILYALVIGLNAGKNTLVSIKDDFGEKSPKGIWEFSKFAIISAGKLLLIPIGWILGLPFLLYTFGEWIEKTEFYRKSTSSSLRSQNIVTELVAPPEQILILLARFIDRIGLVGITLISTMPKFIPIVKIIGVVGLLFALLMFLINGKFSFVIKDNIAE
jgi:hypothetical protein